MTEFTDYVEWKERGPLRRWRRRQGAPQAKIAVLLGKTTQAIRDYESGSYAPDDEALEALAAAMETRPDLLRRRWRRWMAQREEVAS